MARPSKYKKEYCQEIINYFFIKPYRKEKIKKVKKDGSIEEIEIDVANDLPLFSGFATEIGVNRETLRLWSEKFQEFGEAYQQAKELQRNILITNGLRGLYNTTFAIFTAKNITDMRDQQQLEFSGSLSLQDAREIAKEILN